MGFSSNYLDCFHYSDGLGYLIFCCHSVATHSTTFPHQKLESVSAFLTLVFFLNKHFLILIVLLQYYHIDIEYLSSLIEKFNGGPVGIETIATSIGEEVSTIEDVVEPYLLQEGFLKRTPRGRVATPKAYDHLHIEV